MPRSPIDYSKTFIYKFVCKDLNITDIYVGHTTSFTHRKREHKSRLNKNYEFSLYTSIRNNGGWDNWEMIEIEKYSCKDANEARARERYWYEELNSKLNMRIPITTIEEKKEHIKLKNNTEERKLYMFEYNKNLTQEQKEQKKEYNNIWKNKKYICECGSIIRQGEKTRHFKTDKHLNYQLK